MAMSPRNPIIHLLRESEAFKVLSASRASAQLAHPRQSRASNALRSSLVSEDIGDDPERLREASIVLE